MNKKRFIGICAVTLYILFTIVEFIYELSDGKRVGPIGEGNTLTNMEIYHFLISLIGGSAILIMLLLNRKK
jgi:hypothetical protein